MEKAFDVPKENRIPDEAECVAIVVIWRTDGSGIAGIACDAEAVRRLRSAVRRRDAR